MATPNYSYEKRQRELAKKRKNEEKLQKKKQPGSAGGADETSSGNDKGQADARPSGPAGTPPAP